MGDMFSNKPPSAHQTAIADRLVQQCASTAHIFSACYELLAKQGASCKKEDKKI